MAHLLTDREAGNTNGSKLDTQFPSRQLPPSVKKGFQATFLLSGVILLQQGLFIPILVPDRAWYKHLTQIQTRQSVRSFPSFFFVAEKVFN